MLKRRPLLVRLFRSYMGWRAYLGVIESAKTAWAVSTALMDEQSPRIRGRAWMTIRDRIMRRDCGLCQECKRNGKVKPGTQVICR